MRISVSGQVPRIGDVDVRQKSKEADRESNPRRS